MLAIDEHHGQIAANHFNRGRMSLVMHHWSHSVIEAKVNEWRATKEANRHRDRHLLKTAFFKWTRLKVILRVHSIVNFIHTITASIEKGRKMFISRCLFTTCSFHSPPNTKMKCDHVY